MDNTRSVPPSAKNPFDGDFAVDGTRYQTATSIDELTNGSLPLRC